MADSIVQWLEGLGLGQYAQAFADNDIEFAHLDRLTENDLKELGMSIGHRRTLQAAIEKRLSETSPTVRSAVTAPDAEQSTSAQRRQLTVLFCDLVGSTERAARLDPEEMRDLLLAYQQACSAVIARYDGFIAKFMGDGVYAYFGYPTAHEDDAERAIAAALGITGAVTSLGKDLAVRIGVATGNVAVGDLIGEGPSEEANVVGEAPNLAARLQSIAAPNTVLIADATHRLAGGMFECLDLGGQDLKGFAEPVCAWRVVRTRATESRFQAIRGDRLTRLVGREEELQILCRRWQQAKNGEGQVVLISGEPGIGKSRLVHTFRDSIRDEKTHVRLLQCSPLHSSSALFPFLEPALSAIGITAEASNETKLDRLDSWIRAGGQDPVALAPVFGPFLNIDTTVRYPPLDLPPHLHKARLFDAFSNRLLQIAENQGLVFVVEDAHWIDPSTLELLGMHIEQAQGRGNVMIIVSYRPEFNAPWVGRPHTTLIALKRLSPRQCVTLITNIEGSAELKPELVDRISQRTDGIPLFVEELTKVVLESTGKDNATAAIDVPATLHDSLVARLDHLGPAREIAQLAACIGRSFSSSLLAAVCDLPATEMEDALRPLLDSGLIYAERQREGTGYTFKHAMVQQAAYGGLLRSARQTYHGRIAAALIAAYDRDQSADPIGIAQHLQAANDIARALLWFRRAAEKARDAGSVRESLAIIGRAFELLKDFEGSELERDCAELDLLAVQLPVTIAIEGYASEAINRISARALELAVALGNRERESAILYQIATMHEVRGEFSETQATLARRSRLLDQQVQPEPVIETGELMACSTFYEGRFDTSIEHARKALQYADPEQPSVLGNTLAEEPTIACLFWIAKSLLLQGRIEEARARRQEAFECARRSPHWYARSQAEIDAALLCAFQRDFVAARGYAGQAADSSAQVGLAYREAVARLIVEWAGTVGDALTPDIGQMEKSLKVFREVGAMIGYSFYLALAAECHMQIGAVETGAALIDEALELSARCRGFFFESELYRLKGALVLRGSGKKAAEEAEALFRTALDVANAQGARLFALRSANAMARLYLDEGRRKKARDLLLPIYGGFNEDFDTADLKEAKAMLAALS